jgi:hypothetical protein
MLELAVQSGHWLIAMKADSDNFYGDCERICPAMNLETIRTYMRLAEKFPQSLAVIYKSSCNYPNLSICAALEYIKLDEIQKSVINAKIEQNEVLTAAEIRKVRAPAPKPKPHLSKTIVQQFIDADNTIQEAAIWGVDLTEKQVDLWNEALQEILFHPHPAKPEGYLTPALNPHGTNQYSGHYNPENVMSSKQQGNGNEYRIAKLRRDNEDTFNRYCNGEFKTVAEAERVAGVKPSPKDI